MAYKITWAYTYYKPNENEKYIVKTYMLNEIPFTFDDVTEEEQEDPEVIKKAEEQMTMTPEIFFLKSFYLIEEEAHPCVFDLELENPEVLEELM